MIIYYHIYDNISIDMTIFEIKELCIMLILPNMLRDKLIKDKLIKIKYIE